jgi:TPR repeat protein
MSYQQDIQNVKNLLEQKDEPSIKKIENFIKQDKYLDIIKKHCENLISNYQTIDHQDGVILYHLGNVYYHRNDFAEAQSYYEKSLSLKCKYAVSMLASIHYHIRRDYKSAFETYKIGCGLGCGWSYYCIGYMFEQGQYVEQNYQKAIEYYEIACDMNYYQAFNNLGRLYLLDVDKSEQNIEKTIKCYERGCEFNDKTAFYNLGNMYYYGEFVKKDYKKAKEFLTKSYNLGHNKAIHIIYDILYEEKEYIKASLAVDEALSRKIDIRNYKDKEIMMLLLLANDRKQNIKKIILSAVANGKCDIVVGCLIDSYC